MAGQLPSVLSGNSVVVRIGNRRIAYLQNLQFSRRVDTSAIYGLGSPSVMALEPTNYGATWSAQIVRYTTPIITGDVGTGTLNRAADANALPDNLKNVAIDDKVDGNSLIEPTHFNPQLLLLSQSFDVEVYEKAFPIVAQDGTVTFPDGIEGNLLFLLKDCRIGRYSFNFAPGELLIENISGVCRRIDDAQVSV